MLCCLLVFVAHASVLVVKSLPRRSAGEIVLTYFVLAMCIGSVIVCLVTIMVELSASFAYYGRAFKLRYRTQRKLRLRSEYSRKDSMLQKLKRCCRQRPAVIVVPLVEAMPQGVGGMHSTSWAQLMDQPTATARPARSNTDSIDLTDLSAAALRAHDSETKAVREGRDGMIVEGKQRGAVSMTTEEVHAHRAHVMQFVESTLQGTKRVRRMLS